MIFTQKEFLHYMRAQGMEVLISDYLIQIYSREHQTMMYLRKVKRFYSEIYIFLFMYAHKEVFAPWGPRISLIQLKLFTAINRKQSKTNKP